MKHSTQRPADEPVKLNKQADHIAELFDQIAGRYDLINDLGSVFQTKIWRFAARQAVNTRPGEKVLDVAAGTGASSVQYHRDGAEVTACDISDGMLEVGRENYPDIEFVNANALNLPFDDNTFDVVTISYGLRNVEDTDGALKEFYRVTKPGGRLVIVEFSRPVFAPFRWIYHAYLRFVMPKLASWFGNESQSYVYLMQSVMQWPDQKRLGYIVRRAGWSRVRYKNLTNGIVAIHHAVKE